MLQDGASCGPQENDQVSHEESLKRLVCGRYPPFADGYKVAARNGLTKL